MFANVDTCCNTTSRFYCEWMALAFCQNYSGTQLVGITTRAMFQDQNQQLHEPGTASRKQSGMHVTLNRNRHCDLVVLDALELPPIIQTHDEKKPCPIPLEQVGVMANISNSANPHWCHWPSNPIDVAVPRLTTDSHKSMQGQNRFQIGPSGAACVGRKDFRC